ncbi:MAG: hypothetical protein JXR66_07960 [Bacteroidales bacterium]|nr:hypothetical protein [Bacteroidales bacterium]MBN2633473.1 hypothetical protein [Bacteroidales bacterium]
MKKIFVTLLLISPLLFPLSAQTGEQDLSREVTLYNPYKPSLPDFRKRSYMPDIIDTTGIMPDFSYDVTTRPFTPEYSISPLKPVSLLPDPLPRLYKSFVKFGIGNYMTPLAEVSITNERSKRNTIGFYGRHFSTNGKVLLQNGKQGFAGYMDNDLSLFGKKFFRKNFLEGSVDFTQKLRYAYGYDTSIKDYEPEKKEIRLGYNNLSADISFASLTLDSSDFSYDFDLRYDYFYNTNLKYQHSLGLSGEMAREFEGFYLGSGIAFDYVMLSKSVSDRSKYTIELSPFATKSTPQWSFRAGLKLLLDRNIDTKADFYIYPDAYFGFSIVPSYLKFHVALNGKLERNQPAKVIEENPFIIRDGTLFMLPNTSHSLIVSAGLNGNTGIGGTYLFSASYSLVNNILFYSNIIDTVDFISPQTGNLFIPLPDEGEILKIHGEMNGPVKDKLWYTARVNWYKYTLAQYDYPWNKPDWDAEIGLKYNLRDKIIAGAEISALGRRRLAVSDRNVLVPLSHVQPMHVNINLSAEYRYTKILSFWLKLNNIAFNDYYEWAYYPTQRFIALIGFSYSL